EDYGIILEICDQVRSKQMPARDVARSIRRRIAHKNPNVQILALKLTDMLVKNGGAPFLAEVAGREFMDDLVSLIHAPQTVLHFEVQRLLLQLIQDWALALQSKPEYPYPVQVYHRLKAEGLPFPAPGRSNAPAIVETATAPEWTDSDVCMRCRTGFTMTNRKHHCRNCGQTFCQQCSSNNSALPHFGMSDPVRVCHGCYLKLKKIVYSSETYPGSNQLNGSGTATSKSTPHTSHSIKPEYPHRHSSSRSRSSSAAQASSAPAARAGEEDDEDLKLAIQLSLKEAQQHRRSYNSVAMAPKAPPVVSQGTTSVVTHARSPSGQTRGVEEEDPDLAAAIAASIQEMRLDEARRTGRPTNTAPGPMSPANSSFLSSNALPGDSTGQGTVGSVGPVALKSYELSTLEKENIELFATLLLRVQNDAAAKGAQPNLHEHPQLPYLHEQIGKLQPKLARNLAEVVGTHERLLSLHAKIGQAVRQYDGLLDQRISLARHNSTPGGGDPKLGTTTAMPSSYAPGPPHPTYVNQTYPGTPFAPSAHNGGYPLPPPQGA
ncbi:hypothetical protein BJ085DRAFT_9741, partial [Dimargaris cristalligena]